MSIILFVYFATITFQVCLIYALVKLLKWLSDKNTLISNFDETMKQEVVIFRNSLKSLNYMIENPPKPTIQANQIIFLVLDSAISWHYSKKVPIKKLINFLVKNYKKILPLLLKI